MNKRKTLKTHLILISDLLFSCEVLTGRRGGESRVGQVSRRPEVVGGGGGRKGRERRAGKRGGGKRGLAGRKEEGKGRVQD